jgi:hypothetical protein
MGLVGAGRSRSRIALGLAGLALAAAGLACLAAPAALTKTYAGLSLALEDRLQTRPQPIATRITLGPGGRDLRLWGEIAEGAADRLGQLLDANRQVERIHLTSEGGLVDEAEAIAARVAARGLVTYVPDYCVSACTLVFVRGRERLIQASSRLGFHAPYEPGLFGQAFQADASPERRAYLAAGVDAAFATKALRVASDDLWVPDAARLLAARVATGVVDSGRFPDSGLDDDDSLDAARSAILRNLDLLAEFKEVPGLTERLALWYRDAYRAGVSEGEALDGLRRLAAAEVMRAACGAGAAPVLGLGRYLLKAMRAAPSDICSRIGGAGDVALAQEVLAGETPRGASGARGACTELISAYAEALARPDPDASAALRHLLFRGGLPVQEVSALP